MRIVEHIRVVKIDTICSNICEVNELLHGNKNGLLWNAVKHYKPYMLSQ